MIEFTEILFAPFRRRQRGQNSQVQEQEQKKFPMRINDAMVLNRGEVIWGPKRELSDGCVVKQGDMIGKIDVLPKIIPGERPTDYLRRIKPLVEEGLIKIARLAQEDENIKKFKVFGGVSMIGGHAKPYGFDLFDVDEDFHEHYREAGKKEVKRAIGENSYLEKISNRKQRSTPIEALMSRETLIQKYATPQLENTSQTQEVKA